jgi:dipeptidyl aminopeptidase/acylaminoacyl peptidase
MTTNEGFDRRLSGWLERDAVGHVPDHLDEVLLRTVVTRQRPWWSSPERWLPMDLTTRANPLTAPRIGRPLLMALLLIALVMALVVVAVGTQRRVPQPFGVARNGAIVTSHDGDIYKLDPATNAAALLIGGDSQDFAPAFSRDGLKMSFLRGPADPSTQSGLALMVADADGSNVRQLTPFVDGLDWADWSADSKQIAYLSIKANTAPGPFNPRPHRINLVNVDGSGSRTLDVPGDAQVVAWLPPDGREIVLRSAPEGVRDPGPRLLAVRSDGTGRRTLATRLPENENDFMTPAVAPDGSHVTYTSNGAVSHIHVLDPTTFEDRVLPDPTGGLTDQFGTAYFSPDGRSVGYLRAFPEDSTYQFVVAPVDGTTTGIPIGPRLAQPTGDVNWAFAPDGRSVIVDFDNDGSVWMLPVDGSPGTVLARGAAAFGDIQRLAP